MRTKTMRWVSVKDKLPNFNEQVMLAVPKESPKPNEVKFWFETGYLTEVRTSKSAEGEVITPQWRINNDGLDGATYWAKIEEPA